MNVGLNGGRLKTKAMCCLPTLEAVSKMKNEAPGVEEATTKDASASLGSLLTQDLKDNDDAVRQINQAKAQAQELTNTWTLKEITPEFENPTAAKHGTAVAHQRVVDPHHR
jgi:hypothetical protein